MHRRGVFLSARTGQHLLTGENALPRIARTRTPRVFQLDLCQPSPSPQLASAAGVPPRPRVAICSGPGTLPGSVCVFTIHSNQGIDMAKDHFAIERPRKISISIQGYDARARVTEQRKKQQERSKRLRRKQKREPVPASTPAGASASQVDEAEIEALATAATTLPNQLESDLRAAFAGTGKGAQA